MVNSGLKELNPHDAPKYHFAFRMNNFFPYTWVFKDKNIYGIVLLY